jgi:hypothetical protein
MGQKLFYFALALLAVSLVVFSFNVSKIMSITGHVTGTANLSIGTTTQINFTTYIINWGSGQVNPGLTYATLNTSVNGALNVSGGNWTNNNAGLVLKNIGNVNVTLVLQTGKDANALLGGTSPGYQWNITDVVAGTGAVSGCLFTSNITEGAFANVNSSASGTTVCTTFSPNVSANAIRIDIALVVPSDSKTGAIGDIITATATAS